jgi:hypothetical protein
MQRTSEWQLVKSFRNRSNLSLPAAKAIKSGNPHPAFQDCRTHQVDPASEKALENS